MGAAALAGSQFERGIVGCLCHVWGPQPYLMASLHAVATFCSVADENNGAYSSLQLGKVRCATVCCTCTANAMSTDRIE